jgi:hypothetical protein
MCDPHKACLLDEVVLHVAEHRTPGMKSSKEAYRRDPLPD